VQSYETNRKIPIYLKVLSLFQAMALPFQFPTVVAVVNHLMGHATVDADVLAGDEAGFG
jgi:hypothetical protein